MRGSLEHPSTIANPGERYPAAKYLSDRYSLVSTDGYRQYAVSYYQQAEMPVTSSRTRRRCRTCSAPLAADNRGDQCSPCVKAEQASSGEVPRSGGDFWARQEVQDAITDRHFGRLLRAYRRAHGIRQATVADWFGLAQGRISSMERAAGPVTDLAKLDRWCQILRIPQEHLWFTLSAQHSDGYDTVGSAPTLRAVREITGDDVQRRQFLKSTAVGVATVGASLLGSTPTAATTEGLANVEDIRSMTKAYRAADNRFGGGHSRTALNAYFESTVKPMLDDTSIIGSLRRELFTAAAEMRQLAGWMAYDVGHASDGRTHLREALRLCQHAGDEALAGEMLAAMSHHAAFLGSGDAAVDLALAAHQSAARAGIPALQAESAVMEAHGLAMQNDRGGCMDALRRAETAFERINPANSPAWLSYFDAPYMAAKFAHAFRDLGMAPDAERFARRSLDMSDGYDRGKLFNTALLASALADQRRVDEACASAKAAVRMAGSVRSVRATAYLGDVARRLAPYRTAEVRALYREMDQVGLATPRI
ncbi:helix-turn-helix domain-containing protein [Amycolatopsis jejuensis]|uniref:helix-turn-helix domain-containing protein n=1 Tax=Amycolatopsis jejuensis TaxID=330084 RepID=UPI001FDFAD44|nr:helix-turn-helix transcriptional regulator [Amycolatopsis jejuensis]